MVAFAHGLRPENPRRMSRTVVVFVCQGAQDFFDIKLGNILRGEPFGILTFR